MCGRLRTLDRKIRTGFYVLRQASSFKPEGCCRIALLYQAIDGPVFLYLAPRESDLVHACVDEHARQPQYLLLGDHLCLGLQVDAVLRHTVHASQVTPATHESHTSGAYRC